MDYQYLIQEIKVLPPELQKQVSDFVIFLRRIQKKQPITRRTVGEYRNKISIHQDFDKPLNDEFWLGKET